MVETVISDYMSPQCDLDLEDRKPLFLHDTLTNDDASPYHLWLQKVQQLGYNCPDEHLLEFWTFLWPWPWPQLSIPIFSQDNPAYNYVPSKPSLVVWGSAVQKIYQKVIVWLYDPSLYPWPWRQQINLSEDNLGHDDASPYQILVIKG